MSEESRLFGYESARVAHDAIVTRLVDSIRGADIIEAPFPHLIIDRVFPEQVFKFLVDDLPDPESMPSAAEQGWASVAQYAGQRTSLFDELQVRDLSMWHTVEQALLSHEIEQAAVGKFISWISPSSLGLPLRREVRLDCTVAGAFIKPHTDHPVAFIKQLIYLTPSKYDKSLDTLLYAPRDAALRMNKFGTTGDFRADDYRHESPELHMLADRVEHQPNRMFVFLRSVNSLHGFGPLRCSTPRFLIAVHRQFTK